MTLTLPINMGKHRDIRITQVWQDAGMGQERASVLQIELAPGDEPQEIIAAIAAAREAAR